MKLDPRAAEEMRDRLLIKLENEHRTTTAVLEHLPQDMLAYTPAPKLRDFSTLATHIYESGNWFAGIIESGKVDMSRDNPKPAAPKTKADLLANCDRLYQTTVKRLRAVSADQLTREVPFATFGTFPAVTFLDWHLAHLIHHRGQLTVYLRVMGAKVPAVYGDSLDYPFNTGA